MSDVEGSDSSGFDSVALVGLYEQLDLPESIAREYEFAAGVLRSREVSRTNAKKRLGEVNPGLSEAVLSGAQKFRCEMMPAVEVWKVLDQISLWSDQTSYLVLSGGHETESVVQSSLNLVQSRPDRLVGAVAGGTGLIFLGSDENVPKLGFAAELLERILSLRVRIDLVVVPATFIEIPDEGFATWLIAIDGDFELEGTEGQASSLGAGSGIKYDNEKFRVSSAPGVAAVVSIPVVNDESVGQLAASNAALHPLLRSAIPTDRTLPIDAYAGSVVSHPEVARDELSALTSEFSFERGLARHVANLPVRVRSGTVVPEPILQTPTVDWVVRCQLVAGFAVQVLSEGAVRLAANERVAAMPQEWAELIGALAIGEPIQVGEVARRFKSVGAVDLDRLVRASCTLGWFACESSR